MVESHQQEMVSRQFLFEVGVVQNENAFFSVNWVHEFFNSSIWLLSNISDDCAHAQ